MNDVRSCGALAYTTRRIRTWVLPKVLGALALPLVGGCKDSPTTPNNVAIERARIMASPQLEPLGVALSDASERLSASVKEAAARARLQTDIEELSLALNKGDAENGRRFLALTRSELGARDAQEGPGGGADRAAIALALDVAEQLLNPPSPTPDVSILK